VDEEDRLRRLQPVDQAGELRKELTRQAT